MNLLARERRHVEEVAKGMGMTVEYGHDIVSKYENFYSVNIPADHPATEMHDTIYLKEKDKNDENYVLRTHTSAHQVQFVKKHGVPLYLLSIGRVYRYEKLDASHDTAFRQIEGMVIDK
jgi:phenylalanyl-tRNA synthetase alpha chain